MEQITTDNFKTVARRLRALECDGADVAAHIAAHRFNRGITTRSEYLDAVKAAGIAVESAEDFHPRVCRAMYEGDLLDRLEMIVKANGGTLKEAERMPTRDNLRHAWFSSLESDEDRLVILFDMLKLPL